MRPAEIPNETIVQAGLELVESGRSVTGFALRQKVGGGNPNRLKQVWDEHLAKGQQPAEPVAELPLEVAEEVTGFTGAFAAQILALATNLNDKAVKAAERRVRELVQAAVEQRTQAERELADAATAVEELENSLDEVRQTLTRLQEAHADVLEKNRVMGVDLAQVRERLAMTEKAAAAASQQHAAELSRMQKVVDQEHQHLVDVQRLAKAAAEQHAAEVGRLGVAHSKTQDDLAETQAREKAALQEQGALRLQLVEAQGQAAHAGAESKRLRTELDASAAAVKKLEGAVSKAEENAGKAREDLARVNGELQATKGQVAQLMKGAQGDKSGKGSKP